MKTIRIFLASSNELKRERELFEIEIYRKCKAWVGKGIFLHLDIWEDLSGRMSSTRSQDEYNKKIGEADVFVLLAYSKVGMYTAEEFGKAFGQFQKSAKPFIFTYFIAPKGETELSLQAFKDQLKALGHFESHCSDFNDFWNQFNKELERLEDSHFQEHPHDASKGGGAKFINHGKVGQVNQGSTVDNRGANFNL